MIHVFNEARSNTVANEGLLYSFIVLIELGGECLQRKAEDNTRDTRINILKQRTMVWSEGHQDGRNELTRNWKGKAELSSVDLYRTNIVLEEEEHPHHQQGHSQMGIMSSRQADYNKSSHSLSAFP
jgi:hypothetical protein